MDSSLYERLGGKDAIAAAASFGSTMKA